MNLILSLITNTGFLKTYFFGVASVTTLSIVQESAVTNTTIYETLIKNIPAQVMMVLAVIAGCIYVFRLADEAYTKYKLNRLTVKKDKEHLEQEEITTERQRKKL